MIPHEVLLLEDNEVDADLVRARLRAFANVTLVRSRESFLEAISSCAWDAVLVDWSLPGFSGEDALNFALGKHPDTPVIVISGAMDDQQAIAALNIGASDFLSKEFLSLLVPMLERALHERKFRQQILRMQRMENIGSLATGITHDLNNLLSHMALASGIVQRTCSEAHRNILQKTDASIERATALVQHLVTFARGEDLNLQSTLDMGQLLHDVVVFLQETSAKNIELITQISGPLPAIKGNRTQVQQVIQNLLVNARDALGEHGGVIKVFADKMKVEDFVVSTSAIPISGEFIRVSVQDSNGGISDAILPHIFELFYTTKTKGSGIGLSTVRSIMHSHRGHIDVTSHIGIGSTFTLLFPVQQPGPTVPTIAAALPQGSGELILLVDDELAVLDVMTKILETCNYRVLAAGSGSEGLALYRKRAAEIAVVVTDVQMESLGGLALAALLRQTNPSVKIVFISGMDNNPAMRRAAGADAFLLKPFSADVFLATLSQLCVSVDKAGGS